MEATEVSRFLRVGRSARKPISLRLSHKCHQALTDLLANLAEKEIHLSRHELLVACLQEGLAVIQARFVANTPAETENP